MPITKGKGKAIFKRNMRELLRAAKRKGKIGNVPTRTTAKAQQVAAAIAYGAQRGG